jgi:hypothetical protein
MASANSTVELSPTAPAIGTPVGQPVNGSAIEVLGTGEAGDTVTLYADGGTRPVGTGTVAANGSFDITTRVTFADGPHTLTATQTDAAGLTSAASADPAVVVNPTAPVITTLVGQPISGSPIEVTGTGEAGDTVTLYETTNSYSTNFPVAQNPISENGNFVTSTSPAVNWSGLELGGGGNLPVAPVDIAAPGEAESVDYADPNYGDALAVLTGTWGANQSVSITVGDIPATSAGYEELEIHLRTDPTTGTGYEITWAYNHDYILIATWNGGGVVGTGAYTTLYYASGSQYAIAPSDTLTASIQGDVITMYTDGVQVAQIVDGTFSSGNPGFGFNQGGTGEYAISSFSASSTTPVGTGTVAADGSFDITTSTSFADGPHTLTATQTDAAGLTSAASAGFAVAVIPPLSGQVVLTSIAEGVATSVTVASFTDTDLADAASSFTATVNWGDGTTEAGTITGANGSFAVAVPSSTHFYADDGTDTVTVTITRTADETQIAPTGTVTVADAALGATGTTISGTEGIAINDAVVATFTDANLNATVSDFTATINWGDGTTTIGTIVAQNGGGFAVEGGHTYADAGQYTAEVSINDVGGSAATTTSTATMADAPLTATGVSLTGMEGSPTGTVTVATFTDANPNATASDFTATINWGDGSTTTGTIVAQNSGGFAIEGGHTYVHDGQYVDDVTINDIGGGTASAGFAVAVDPSAPSPSPPAVHVNDLSYSSTASGPNHFVDLLNFEASYPDLVAAFGTNQAAMQDWYNTREPIEIRVETFDGLDYIASFRDLISAFGAAGSMKAVQDDGASHFITNGQNEGRMTNFNGLDYIASYSDLIKAFGANNDMGAYHYIENGHNEGRTTSFDGLDYIASYVDLIKAFGANEQAGAAHFITNGYNEGRTTTFDGLAYIAQSTDLMKAFGANSDLGATHYIQNGFYEGRSTAFNVGAYESAHPDLIGKYASNDAFLTAYINTYNATGTFLT